MYNIYRGQPYQRGYGLGGTFRRFFSWIVPLFKQHAVPVLNSGLRELGTTAINTATDIIKDTSEGKNFKTSAKERIDSAVDSIKDKIEKKLRGEGKKAIKRNKKTRKITY